MKGFTLIVFGTFLCAMTTMAAPTTNDLDFGAVKELGQHLIDAISEAVENTEAKDIWEENKAIIEQAFNNLVNCEQSADPAVCYFEKLMDLIQTLGAALEAAKISDELALEIRDKLNKSGENAPASSSIEDLLHMLRGF